MTPITTLVPHLDSPVQLSLGFTQSWYLDQLKGLSATFLCFTAPLVIFPKQLRTHFDLILKTYLVNLAGMLVAALSILFNPKQTLFSSKVLAYTTTNWLYLLSISTLGLVSNWCTTKAFQLTDPTTVIGKETSLFKHINA